MFFFTEIKQDWTKHKLSKKQLEASDSKIGQPIVAEPEEIYSAKEKKESENKSPFNEKGLPPKRVFRQTQ